MTPGRKTAPVFNLFPGINYRAIMHLQRVMALPLPAGYAGPPFCSFSQRGDLTFDLLPREAPKNVNNFVWLARQHFYATTSFHRVVPGKILQGGCPVGDGTGGPGYHVDDDQVTKPYVRGILAMASAGRNKNGSQFFIVIADRISIPPNYTIIGQLVAGEQVLQELGQMPVDYDLRGERSRPLDRLAIVDIDIVETPLRV